MTTIVVDVLGWLGAIALLGAYLAVSARRVAGDSLGYQLPNVLGSALLIVNSSYYGAYPSAALNVVWAGIGLSTLLARRRRAAAACPEP